MKHPLLSKTVWGIILGLFIGLGAIFGIEPVQELPVWGQAILQIVAGVWAIYGRAVAQGPLR